MNYEARMGEDISMFKAVKGSIFRMYKELLQINKKKSIPSRNVGKENEQAIYRARNLRANEHKPRCSKY